MLVSMNWIKEYVDLAGEDLEKLIMKFTLSTAEVEEIYFKGKEVNNVVVGEIGFVTEKMTEAAYKECAEKLNGIISMIRVEG